MKTRIIKIKVDPTKLRNYLHFNAQLTYRASVMPNGKGFNRNKVKKETRKLILESCE